MNRQPPLYTVCIDDTDRPGARSTARLAQSILELLAPRYRCWSLTIHPHLREDRPRGDSGGNHSACMRFEDTEKLDVDDLIHQIRCLVLEDLVEGSNPGLCAGRRFSPEVRAFAARSRTERLEAEEAEDLARASGLHLEGLAGTGRGIIGALAGAGMAAAGGPGTFLQLGSTPMRLRGLISPRKLTKLGIEHFVDAHSGVPVPVRPLWSDRHLRPVMRAGRPVVLVESTPSGSLAFVGGEDR